jgi:chromate reductase, NAD(P)H dehydrogenase (quinone)
VNILAISGSLQSGSSNVALLDALQRLQRNDVEVTRYPSLGDLPHFNPDLQDRPGADPVGTFRAAVQAADGLLIATPEYAHGMPGVLKNALDWLVGTGELYGKAVVVLSAAPSETRAGNARAWTEQTLRAQGADVRMSATVAVRRAHPDDLRDPSVSAALIRALDSFKG